MLVMKTMLGTSVLLHLGDHPVRDGLREEERSLEIDANEAVETLLGGFEDIQPLEEADAGGIDQQVDVSERRESLFHEPVPVGRFADIAGERDESDPTFFDARFDLEKPFFGVLRREARGGADDIVSAGRVFEGNAASDPRLAPVIMATGFRMVSSLWCGLRINAA